MIDRRWSGQMLEAVSIIAIVFGIVSIVVGAMIAACRLIATL